MALTYGFYNSRYGDRKYDAIQMSSIFDGIIRDGIIMTIGDYFKVTAPGGMQVKIGSGRAWFDHTWTYNDSEMTVGVRFAETILNRIDALVLEIDFRDEARTNSIKFVYGTPASIPVRPALLKEEYRKQYPLAYIYVGQGVTEITQANITNMIGTNECPFVTAPLEKLNADALLAQWVTQGQEQQKFWEKQTGQQQTEFDEFYIEMRTMYGSLESLSFHLINNNFDDWSTKRGCNKDTIFNADGSITEKITVVDLDFTLANKNTTFNADGSITEKIQFFPWVTVEGGNTIETTPFTITKDTIFNPGGSITEIIR